MRLLVAVGTLLLTGAIARAADSICCPAPDVTGRWVGCWESDKNGHHGPLRANVHKVSDTCYRVVFAGRFFKVIPFVYAVTLTATEVRGDAVVLTGDLYLGPGLGTFRCDAVVTTCTFDARFSAKSDSGRFTLTRP
jgi:hypothetical protein